MNIKLGQHKIKVLNLIMREVLELQEPYKFRVKFGIKSGSKFECKVLKLKLKFL